MFSVIMPAYNGERFIEDAIESVISQTYRNWELVIVNDGSTDNTLSVLSQYADNPKIKVITQPNGGVSAARNTAMQNASYDYFAFLDCDDLWLDNHLETLAKMVEQYPDAGTYATLAQIRLADGRKISNIDYFENRPDKAKGTVYIEDFFAEYDRDKKAKTHFPSCACVSRKAAEVCGGFKKGCKIGEDLAFFLTAAVYFPVVLSSEVTSVYEKGNSTATKDVSFDPDWYFFEDVKKILGDETVAESTKKSIKNVMQWFTMRRCRHYIIDGKKKKAWKSFFEIGRSPKLFKDKLITFFVLLMPKAAVRKIFMIRWRSRG